MSRLFNVTVLYTTLGLAGGLAYRELTRTHAFTGFSQLGLVHTHFLILGTFWFLIVLALDLTLRLGEHKLFNWFFGFWNAGLLVTGLMMAYRGAMTVLGTPLVSKAWAGISGMGHILLTVGFVLFLMLLKGQLSKRQAAAPVAVNA